MKLPPIRREGVGEPPGEEEMMYQRWYERFLILFACLIALTLILMAFDNTVEVERRVASGLCTIALVPWFWIMGQWRNVKSDLQAVVFLAGLLILIVVAIRMWPGAALQLFAAYWLGFAYLRVIPAMVFVTILTIGHQWAFGVFAGDPFANFEPDIGAIAAILLGIVLSGMMARYIESSFQESDRRGLLLQELRETQAQLAKREREAGVMDERRRLAGELHDTVAQHFTSIVTNLEAAEARAQSDPVAAHQHLQSAQAAARQGIRDSRAMLHAMQPDVLTGRSLCDALRRVVDDARAEAPASSTWTLTIDGTEAALGRVQEGLLIRSAQEALANIRKHALADNVGIRLSWLEDEVILDVEDDGVGFDPEHVAPIDGHHLGLQTMRTRIEAANGTFMMDSSVGEGTSLAVSFPLSTT